MNLTANMMRNTWLVFFLTFRLEIVLSAACTNNNEVGEDNPKNEDIDTNSGYAYLVCATSGRFAFDCCGSITRFEYYAQATGTIVLQVWRPMGGNTYKLVGSVTHTAGATGDQSVPAVFQVDQNDCIGWYTSSTDMVPSKNDGGAPDTIYITSAPTNNVGDTQVFSGGGTVTNERFQINVQQNVPNATVAQPVTYDAGNQNIPDTTAASASVGTVTFTDLDVADTITITMAANNYFAMVNNGDGTASVTLTADANYPINDVSGTTQTLTFTATDSCGSTATTTMPVTIINLPPTLTGLVPGQTESETVGSERQVMTYTCSDTIDDVTGTITVSPSTTPEFFFSRFLSGTNNNAVYEIYLPAQSTTHQFDADSVSQYTITVTCDDGKTLGTDTGTTVISLSANQPPSITNLPAPTSIDVSQTVTNGSIVFTVLFTDPDTDDTIDFTWSCTPTNCPFYFLDSGAMQTIQNMADANSNGYDIIITPVDNRGNLGVSRTLTVVVTDINSSPTFSNLPIDVPIDENIAIGTSIFTVSFTDPDVADTHTFSFGTSSYFEMADTSTGVITTKAVVDYEALPQTSFPIQVTVTDGIKTATDTVTINVNDLNEPLVWNSATYRTDVADGAAVGTAIANPGFNITDEDPGDTYTCRMDCGAADGYFNLLTNCASTSALAVTSVYSLDNTGLGTSVVCTVTAVDTGSHTATTTLSITIDDADNYTPAFTYTNNVFTLSAYTASGVVVGTVTATDEDTGTFGQFTYSMDTSSLPDSYFAMDSATGTISTVVDLLTTCNCSSTSFVMPITAEDQGGLVGSAQVTIYITDATTTHTTTTTDRYRTFFEDTKNIAWFSVAMALCAVIAAVTTFVMIRYVCNGPPLCRFRTGSKFYRRQLDTPPRPLTPRRPPPPKQEPHQSIRRCPPPKGFQFWRSQRIGQ
ncbi:cadherin EGF LAG seven-pass G-type receptor 2-like [Mya arenaria]|uniref:cadherin EGF LAG seven-pass G-type receptor 2-like n=1 Tax=Mya arenaria TaxID=6604 RepID=UPI0022E5EBB5|nr:cadherin EGF LAG seven-pass G-type receptor 2-like [Mya arenaria]